MFQASLSDVAVWVTGHGNGSVDGFNRNAQHIVFKCEISGCRRAALVAVFCCAVPRTIVYSF